MDNPRRKNNFEIIITKDGTVLDKDVLNSVQNVSVNSKTVVLEFTLYSEVNLLESLKVNELYKINIRDYFDEYSYLNKLCFLEDVSYDLSKANNSFVVVVAKFNFVQE